MKYETTQTGWVSGLECYVGNTNIRYKVTNEEERKRKGRPEHKS